MNNGEFRLIGGNASQICSRLLLSKDNVNSKSAQNQLEFANVDYKESLRTKSMASLINEMYSLRRDLEIARKESSDSSEASSPKLDLQTEEIVDKVLAVETEIGRRLRAPRDKK